MVADEPVSALDISVRAQVLTLLDRIQRERGVAFLMISHDLAVVRNVARRVGVMYLGRIIETGPVGAVFARPVHPDLAPDPRLPADTRLWAALQNASGGSWGGCVYDTEQILEKLTK